MTRRDTPQSERRAALDAAIAALDEQRREQSYRLHSSQKQTSLEAKFLIERLNRHIRILSDMREEGPLL